MAKARVCVLFTFDRRNKIEKEIQKNEKKTADLGYNNIIQTQKLSSKTHTVNGAALYVVCGLKIIMNKQQEHMTRVHELLKNIVYSMVLNIADAAAIFSLFFFIYFVMFRFFFSLFLLLFCG